MAALCGYYEATVVEAVRKMGWGGGGVPTLHPFRSLFIEQFSRLLPSGQRLDLQVNKNRFSLCQVVKGNVEQPCVYIIYFTTACIFGLFLN
jgi:hypothetical protein